MFKIHFRGFVSLLLSFAFCVVVVTGIILWLSHSPQTFGLGKGVWKHAHIFTSLLLLVAGLLHLWLNWPIYWCYLWNHTTRRLNRKWELVLALAVVALVASTALLDNHGEAGPLGSMTLRQIAQQSGKPLDQVLSALRQKGIAVHDPADSILEIARYNNSPPDSVIAILQREMPEMARPMHGRLGRQ